MRLRLLVCVLVVFGWMQSARSAEFPMHCVQEMWLDYPGPYDLYVCLTQYGPVCDADVEEELFYGAPSVRIPQMCKNCEPDDGYFRPKLMPGHRLSLSAANAWSMFKTGLESARVNTSGLTPQYFVVPHDTAAEITRDVYFISVPMAMREGKLRGQTLYFGLEVEPTAVTPATFTSVKAGPGAQMKVQYKVDNEIRKGLIWLNH